MAVSSTQRFTRQRPCPVCGGWDQAPRGKGIRCFGFTSEDGQWAHCTRAEYAGMLPQNLSSNTYSHKLVGECGCGLQHDPRPAPKDSKGGWREPKRTIVYSIKDSAGKEIVQHIRLEYAEGDKSFIWRRNGQNNLGGVAVADLPLYGLPELLAAPPGSRAVCVEGEKARDALVKRGILTVGTVTGAKSIPSDATLRPLLDYEVLLWPDDDDDGRSHMDRIAARLVALGSKPRVIAWAEAPEKGDAADFSGDDGALAQLFASAVPYVPSPPGINGSQAEDAQVQLRRMADVEPEAVTWLWHPYIPQGKLTLLEGDPGVGKSWVSLAIATAVSQGRGLLGQGAGAPANVLLASAEDGLGDTIRPRLDAMGADVERIHAVDGPLTLDGVGLLALETAIVKVRPVLVVLDPLVAYLGGTVDIHRANETRHIMAALARLAGAHGLAVLAVRHLTKGTAPKPIYRGLGSIDFTAACRSVLLAGHAADNPQARGLVQIKSNLAPTGPAIGYELRDGHFYWTEKCSLTAEDILAADDGAGASKLEESKAFLRDLLADGPVAADQGWREVRGAGLSEKTVKRAKFALGVRTIRQGEHGRRGGGQFLWELSDLGGQEGHIEDFGPLNGIEV